MAAILGGKNFCVGVEGRGVSTGVDRVPEEATRPGFRYSSATITISLPPMAEDRLRMSSFSSWEGRKLSGETGNTFPERGRTDRVRGGEEV